MDRERERGRERERERERERSQVINLKKKQVAGDVLKCLLYTVL